MTTTYSEQQYEMAYPPGIEHHWWTTARNQLIAEILQRESHQGDALLEVGCGKGVVVKGLRDYGFNIRGAELAEVQPFDGAGEWLDAGVDACDLPAERRAKVRGLLFLDVLEHLPDPESFLKRLEQSFSEASFVVVTVPTCDELWSNYDVFAGHHRRYTLEMLEKLAADLGWTMGDAGYFFRLSYVPMRLMTMLGVKRNLKIVPPSKGTRFLHRLVSIACQIEQKIIPRKIRGSSAYAVFYPGGRS